MYVNRIENVVRQEINMPGQAQNVVKQALIGPAEGWQGWVMRLFTIGPGGHTPRHSHPWPHINYVTGGKGVLWLDGEEHRAESGFIAYIPDNVEHQFRNAGDSDFTLICIVPEEGDK